MLRLILWSYDRVNLADFMNFAEFVKNGFENTCFTATNKALNTAMSVSLFNSFHKLRCLMIHTSLRNDTVSFWF